MTRDEFWQLMTLVDQAALEEGDEDGALAALIEKLSTLPEPEIFGFEENMAQALYALDTRRHAEQSDGSDEGFLACRCYVVARGRAYYDEVLADAAKMPKADDAGCESLLYVASGAWAKATGNDEDDWTFNASVNFETGSNAGQW